jgi:predicted lipoprotein with Yx(FWY)xxD motif
VKRTNVVSAVLLSAALVIAACGGTSSSSKSSGSASSATASSTSASSSASPSTTAAPSSTAASSSTTLSVAMNTKVGKQVIVDSSGKTVYMYEPDGASRESQVPSGIKSVWPAVPTTATSTVGSGLDMTKFRVITNADNSIVAQYNDHLLYTFINDNAPGDANGQALGGVWFTLSPSGDKNA